MKLQRLTPVFIAFALLLSFPTRAQNSAGNSDSIFTDLPAHHYAVTAEGLPLFTTQLSTEMPLGEIPAVSLHYPEYVPLSNAEVRLIKQQKFSIDDSISIRTDYGVSRKKGLLDISFVPIIKKSGKYLRLTSCKIVLTSASLSPGKGKTRTTTKMIAERWPAHSVLRSGIWVKVRVREEGIYQFSASQLASMGFKDINRVKVYGYGGRIQEEAWSFEDENSVPADLNEVPVYRREGSILFFAEGTVRWTWSSLKNQWWHYGQPYSKNSYYFITEGDEPLTLEKKTESATAINVIESVQHHALLDNDAASFYSGGREIYDGTAIPNGATCTYKLSAPDLVEGESATVAIGFAVANSATSTNVAVALNGTNLGKFNVRKYGSDESGYETRTSFSTKQLAVNNSIAFKPVAASSVSLTARLNYIRLTYPRRLSAAASAYAFTPNTKGAATLRIADATADTRLWCIGSGNELTYEVGGTLNGNMLEVPVNDASHRFIIVDAARSYASPEVVRTVVNQDLHAVEPLDMVILIPASGKLRSEAERLAEAHRRKSGLRVKVVTTEEVYNEFSSGTPDATAYRRYMKMLYDRAETDADMPRYLLLFGDCAWDNRMVTAEWNGYSPDDYLLAFEVNDGYNDQSATSIGLGALKSYVTDDYYGWLDDNEGTRYSYNKLDVGIGRFPCSDAATARVMVDKTIAYLNNEKAGAWKNRVYLLGDDINNTLHMTGSERVATSISSAMNDRLLQRKIYWDAYPRVYAATGFTYPQATQELREDMGKGALIFNYIGHGSPDQISHSGVLYKQDFDISSEGRLPLWIMASCEISPYDTRHNDIGRTALYNPAGGAVAMLCASRAVYSGTNEALNTQFITHLLNEDEASYGMGEALRRAKVALVQNSYSGDLTINKLKYAFLGDPALPLAFARQRIVVDSINGQALQPGQTIPLAAGSVARITGYVTTNGQPDATFTGSLTATVMDRKETITCRNNSHDAKTMVYEDRTKTVFEGSDSVMAGRFSISIPIPRDISYSNSPGRLSLYAVNADHSIEANGYCEQFCLNGTDSSLPADTISPTAFIFLDSPDFVDGGVTSSNPIFMAQVSDDAGINISRAGIGHEMELILDNNTADSYILNNNFTYNFGDFRSGSVTYPLSNLTPGAHTLSFRVWDVNNNATTKNLKFYVSAEPLKIFDVNVTENPARHTTSFIGTFTRNEETTATLSLEVYDMNGHKVWSHAAENSTGYIVFPWNLCSTAGAPLPSGIYLYRAVLSSATGKEKTETKKIIIVRQ